MIQQLNTAEVKTHASVPDVADRLNTRRPAVKAAHLAQLLKGLSIQAPETGAPKPFMIGRCPCVQRIRSCCWQQLQDPHQSDGPQWGASSPLCQQ